MSTPTDQITAAVRNLANAITPSSALGTNDATGGYVTSHTEAIMGITSALCKIAESISDLADAVRETQCP